MMGSKKWNRVHEKLHRRDGKVQIVSLERRSNETKNGNPMIKEKLKIKLND